MDQARIDELRKLRGVGMVSAVGEYTPDELSEALDCIQALRAAARSALAVLEDLEESEMARLRGRADLAIDALRKALVAITLDTHPDSV